MINCGDLLFYRDIMARMDKHSTRMQSVISIIVHASDVLRKINAKYVCTYIRVINNICTYICTYITLYSEVQLTGQMLKASWGKPGNDYMHTFIVANCG